MSRRSRLIRAALALALGAGAGAAVAQKPPPSSPIPGGPSTPPSSAVPATISPSFTAPIPTGTTPPGTGTAGATPGGGGAVIDRPVPSGDFTDRAPRDLPPIGLPGSPQGGPPPLAILDEDQIEPGELLLAWRHPAEADAGIEEIARSYRLRPAQRIELKALRWSLAVYRLRSSSEAAELRVRLLRARPHWLADFNTRYAALAKPRSYARTRVGAPAAVRAEAGRGVRVGILDGPVAPSSALTHRSIATRVFLATNERPAAEHHGTAIAALIAGWDRGNGFAGVAPGAATSVGVVMRERSGKQETTIRAVLEGLDWLLQERAQVVNLSLGGPPNRLLAAAIIAVLRTSVVVVAAGGNDGPHAQPCYPAAYPGVLAVTATDSVDRIYAQANRGSYLALSAPGVDVWAPDGGPGHYATGTSYAAAIVTGAVAVLLERHPDLSPPTLQQHLCRNAKDLGDPGRDSVFGCGLVQLEEP
jgi:Subtilase family